jgi:hypothetical protein
MDVQHTDNQWEEGTLRGGHFPPCECRRRRVPSKHPPELTPAAT